MVQHQQINFNNIAPAIASKKFIADLLRACWPLFIRKSYEEIFSIILPYISASINSYASTDTVLVGKWKGIYYGCNQGTTNAEIDVYDNLSAVFRFYASNSNYGAFDGIFIGNIQRNANSVVFTPIQSGIAAWFVQPSNLAWLSIGFNAALDGSNLSMSGNVNIGPGGSSCTTISLTKVSENNYENNCLFNWAEATYPKLLSPSGVASLQSSPYTYRYYKNTNSYLGVSSGNNHLYYLGPDNTMQDLGLLSGWMVTAGCIK